METASGYLATITEARTLDGLLVIQVKMGRYYLNRAWHVIWLDLKEVVQRAFFNYEGSFGELNKSDWDIVKADKIIITGRMFRMDNICFRVTDHLRLDQQDFFECGPWYAQLFEPYRYLFMADYEANSEIKMLIDLLFEPDNFVIDPNRIRDIWIAVLLKLDPNYHVLDSALWNVGVSLLPNVAFIDYEPQYFEDLILTIQVTNGHNSDTRTFPISVVNYPVENYPLVVQLHTTNRITYVGQEDDYCLKFLDPDCFIFSLARSKGRTPSTAHLPMLPGNQIRTDMEHLTYKMSLKGLASYQYGPWIQSLINPDNGLITLIPRFEGAFEAIVTCTDDRGASAVGNFIYYTFNPGSWLNHPPINFGDPTRLIIARAGEEIILNYPDLKVMDPDGDEMFSSANLGSVGRTANGGFMWSFQTNFPGIYHIDIIFYDIRGGYNIRRMTVVVKPWWSY